MLKASIWDGPLFGGLGIQKHSNSSFYHPQDIKTFEFEVFGPQDLELKPGVMPLDAKSFDWGWSPRFGGLEIKKHANQGF